MSLDPRLYSRMRYLYYVWPQNLTSNNHNEGLGFCSTNGGYCYDSVSTLVYFIQIIYNKDQNAVHIMRNTHFEVSTTGILQWIFQLFQG